MKKFAMFIKLSYRDFYDTDKLKICYDKIELDIESIGDYYYLFKSKNDKETNIVKKVAKEARIFVLRIGKK